MTEATDPLDNESCGPVWRFKGYELDVQHFTTAMVHLYRAEVGRANTWRTRLDTTTNWAVVTFGAALTFAFGALENPHYVLLLEFLLMLAFLYIEARRHGYYQLWSYRVHLMETDFFAAMLAPPFRPSADWSNHLVETLLNPRYPISRWRSVGHRFRRNYFFIMTLLLISWLGKLSIHPVSTATWRVMVERAAIGTLQGRWVMSVVGVIYLGLIGLSVIAAVWPSKETVAPGFLRRSFGLLMPKLASKEQLATIITTQGEEIASRLLSELGRGVTELKGTGMYTHEEKDVLLCAITDVQAPRLTEIVREMDAKAFVIVSRAEEVRGGGFRSFEAPS
jgi:uncharacterized membrane protein